jgi:hypothetical protein
MVLEFSLSLSLSLFLSLGVDLDYINLDPNPDSDLNPNLNPNLYREAAFFHLQELQTAIEEEKVRVRDLSIRMKVRAKTEY